MINPYDLLGVTCDTSAEDVRKAYRALALLHHEDKGGDKEDMISINAAYAFVVRELRHRDVRSAWTPEQVKADFEQFMAAQKEIGPALTTFDPDAFNKMFDELLPQNVQLASVPAGYGSVMDSPEVSRDDASLKQPVSHQFDIVVAEEDEPIEHTNKAFSQAMDLVHNPKEGFGSVTEDGLRMSDYREAFAPPRFSEVPAQDVPMSEDDMLAAVRVAETEREGVVPAVKTSLWADLTKKMRRWVRLEWK